MLKKPQAVYVTIRQKGKKSKTVTVYGATQPQVVEAIKRAMLNPGGV